MAEARGLSSEEKDQIDRSAKKVKGGDRRFSPSSSLPISYEDIVGDPMVHEDGNPKKSFRDTVLGVDNKKGPVTGSEDARDSNMEGSQSDAESEYLYGLEVIEGKLGIYDCPTFILSEKEERRIQKPWKEGINVKLLGRKIGFKALETRLNQMWVRKGIINIIDLGYDFFLVTFSNLEDRDHALLDGPWLIYDHSYCS